MPPVNSSKEEYIFLKQEIETVYRDVRMIKDCLLGNDFTEGKGLVKEIKDLTGRMDTMEETFNKYKNILIGLSLGSGVGLAAIIKAIVDAFTKH